VRILYVTNEYLYINENGRVVRKDIAYEKGIVTSSLGYKNVLSISFKLPKNIEKEMLDIEVERYLFSEGSLDYTKEYKIIYVYQEFDDFYHIDAFVIEINVLKREFEHILKIFKYIDFISFKPFVFKAFYEIVNEPFKNDVFIYLNKDEAFMSCFSEGKFVFVKSLNKLSLLASELNLDIDELIKLLSKNGLNKESYDEETFSKIERFFSEFFMKVNNLINYSVNYYGFNKIDRIFFYSSFDIPNLIENYKEFWSLSAIEFRKYEIPTDYDYFDYTAVIYNSRNYQNEKENFSIFLRPLPFYKRKSGIFVIVLVLLAGFLIIDALIKYQIITKQEKKINYLQKRLEIKKRELKALDIAIKKYKKEIAKLKELNSNIQSQIDDIYQKILLLQKIQQKKPFSNVMADLVDLLKKYDLKIYSFNKNSSHIEIVVATTFDNSYKIAKFLKALNERGYKNVDSSEIMNNGKIYISKVSYDE
jgi:Tfp pilus assembly protein PilN